MRPSRRALLLSFAALVLTVLIVSLPALPAEMAVVPWMALALGLLADIALSPAARDLAVDVTLPAQVFSGEEVALGVAIRPAQRRVPPGAIRLRLDLPAGLDGPDTGTIPRTEAGWDGGLQLLAQRRGVYQLDPIWLAWSSRLGLLEIVQRFAQPAELRVLPNVRPVQSGIIDAKVRASLFGVKDNDTRGQGSEFHQLRDFTAGMDPRTIDWKHSARHRALLAREMRAERNHPIILALDNGYLMREELQGLPRIDHAINASLATAWAAILGGDLVGLYCFDSAPRTYLPPAAGRATFARLQAQTAALAYRSVETNHTLALLHLAGRLQRRSMIVVFSDFVDTTTAQLLIEHLGVLSRTHVIVFVSLRDPALTAMVEHPADSLDAAAESVAAAALVRERRAVLDALGHFGILCLDVAPGQLGPALLSSYLEIKARELI
ncbi:MAG: DUF58 domain-containing protein [Pseudomonadota bacterium]